VSDSVLVLCRFDARIISEWSFGVYTSTHIIFHHLALPVTKALRVQPAVFNKPLKAILAQVVQIQIESLVELVEVVALAVRSPEFAFDKYLDCLEPGTTRFLTERPRIIRHTVRSVIGVALDHTDEASPSQRLRNETLDLKFANTNPKSSMLEARLRINAPASGALLQGDHVRVTAASPPVNSQYCG
jgi:hypothetical protein